MIPAAFAYERPETLVDALQLLRQPHARVLAGGQSLLPAMKVRRLRPELLVDISRIPDLRGIARPEGAIVVGAMTTQRELEDSELVRDALPMIAEAADLVADPTVRSQGTLAGSLAFADPGGDWPAVALALCAELYCIGPEGEFHLPITKFFIDSYRTALPPGTLITHVHLPLPASGTGMTYRKIRHPASGYALVGVAAMILADDDGTCRECHVAITGVGRKAMRAQNTEQLLTGQQLETSAIRTAAEAASRSLSLSDDIYASAPYRAHLVAIEVQRAIETAAQRAARARC